MINYIVVFGNPIDGISFYGPFAERDTAVTWAINSKIDWWIGEIIEPD